MASLGETMSLLRRVDPTLTRELERDMTRYGPMIRRALQKIAIRARHPRSKTRGYVRPAYPESDRDRRQVAYLHERLARAWYRVHGESLRDAINEAPSLDAFTDAVQDVLVTLDRKYPDRIVAVAVGTLFDLGGLYQVTRGQREDVLLSFDRLRRSPSLVDVEAEPQEVWIERSGRVLVIWSSTEGLRAGVLQPGGSLRPLSDVPDVIAKGTVVIPAEEFDLIRSLRSEPEMQ